MLKAIKNWTAVNACINNILNLLRKAELARKSNEESADQPIMG